MHKKQNYLFICKYHSRLHPDEIALYIKELPTIDAIYDHLYNNASYPEEAHKFISEYDKKKRHGLIFEDNYCKVIGE